MAESKTMSKSSKCGVVRPISEWDGCNEAHWSEVGVLINRAAEGAGYLAELVSEADDVGVIHKRIVQNLYECPIIVCDISGRNPNVMFELGMRLAFDKPTVVIKDDKTPFSFDTSPIETLTYPRDLRYSKVEPFVDELTKKLVKSASSKGLDSFLKSFGSFKTVDIEVEKAPIDELILEEISTLKRELGIIRRDSSFRRNVRYDSFEEALKIPEFIPPNRYVLDISDFNYGDGPERLPYLANRIGQLKGIEGVEWDLHTERGSKMTLIFDDNVLRGNIEKQLNAARRILSAVRNEMPE